MSLCNMKLWLFASQQLKTVAVTVYGPAFCAAAAPTTKTMTEISNSHQSADLTAYWSSVFSNSGRAQHADTNESYRCLHRRSFSQIFLFRGNRGRV